MPLINCKIEDYTFIVDENKINKDNHEVSCGSTHKYCLNEGKGIFDIEKYTNGKWQLSSDKDYWIISKDDNYIQLVWLLTGKYRIVGKDHTTNKSFYYKVNVSPNKFKLNVKSEKVGFSAAGLTNVPFKIKKQEGAPNNWRFKYVVSLDDGVTWTSPKEVLVNYDLYGDEYILSHKVYVEPGYGNIVIRFKLVDGRDFYSTQSKELNKEKFYVIQRIPMDLEGIWADKERLVNGEHFVLFGSESEYSCMNNIRNKYSWEIFKESKNKLQKADETDYTILALRSNYLKVNWHSEGNYTICLCEQIKDKALQETIKHKLDIRVVKNNFTINTEFEDKNNDKTNNGIHSLIVNKIGGARNNWKFKYKYGIAEDDIWSDDQWIFVDYKKFGDSFKFNIINNITKNNNGKNLVVKILEARDFHDSLNSGQIPIAELSLN